MATTSNYQLPYPEPSDPVNVAGDIEALAKKIDGDLKEVVQDTVGSMVSSNTENGISVTYSDELGKLNFDITVIPSQSGNTGKYLTTNGSVVSWGGVDALPSQSGNDGKFLTTNGSTASWAIGSFGDVDVTSPITNSGTSTSPNIGINLSNIAPIQSPTFTGTVTSPTIRLTSTTDASLTSTGHAFQVGSTTSTNLIIDNDEIKARNNSSTSPLTLNGDGGSIILGNSTSAISALGTITTSNGIINAQQKNALVASGFNSASGAFAHASRVIMTATASNSTAPTTRPDGTTLIAGDIWISF